MVLVQVVEITENGGVWSIKSSTTLKTIELKFKVNHTFVCGNLPPTRTFVGAHCAQSSQVYFLESEI